jgi:hypothetical protein
MTDTTAQVIQAWTGIAQAVMAFAAFGVLFWQVEQLKKAARGDTHGRLYEHYLRITEMILERKHLRALFYDGKDPGNGNVDEDEKNMVCESILGLLEHAALQERNLPSTSWKQCWEAYTLDRFAQSPVLTEFLIKNYGWYAMDFRKVAAKSTSRLLTPEIKKKLSETPRAEGWIFGVARAIRRRWKG